MKKEKIDKKVIAIRVMAALLAALMIAGTVFGLISYLM